MVWCGVIDCNFATSLFRIVLHIDQTFAQPETSGGSCKPPLASATWSPSWSSRPRADAKRSTVDVIRCRHTMSSYDVWMVGRRFRILWRSTLGSWRVLDELLVSLGTSVETTDPVVPTVPLKIESSEDSEALFTDIWNCMTLIGFKSTVYWAYQVYQALPYRYSL